MNILGINISHDSSSCLVKNGEVIYYLEEERLSKIKHYKISLSTIIFNGIERLKKYNITHLDYLTISTYRHETFEIEKFIINSIVKDIKDLNITIDNIIYDQEAHHLYHAYNAFYNSKFEEAGVLVCDGRGAYFDEFPQHRELETIYKFDKEKHELKFKHLSTFNYDNYNFVKKEILNKDYEIMLSNSISCGQLFTEFGIRNGFSENDAGKLMGMSSYGKCNQKIEWFDTTENNVIFNTFCIDLLMKEQKDNKSFIEKANLFKKLQFETKEYTIFLIQKTIEKANSNNIVLSGGYFMNCVNNYEYLKAFPNVNFYIDPICYDGGTAIGATYAVNKILNLPFNPINNLYLGG
jgi:carbamoyltransferase